MRVPKVLCVEGCDRNLHVFLPHRHHLVPLRRPELRYEVWQLDLQRVQGDQYKIVQRTPLGRVSNKILFWLSVLGIWAIVDPKQLSCWGHAIRLLPIFQYNVKGRFGWKFTNVKMLKFLSTDGFKAGQWASVCKINVKIIDRSSVSQKKSDIYQLFHQLLSIQQAMHKFGSEAR